MLGGLDWIKLDLFNLKEIKYNGLVNSLMVFCKDGLMTLKKVEQFLMFLTYFLRLLMSLFHMDSSTILIFKSKVNNNKIKSLKTMNRMKVRMKNEMIYDKIE